MMRLACISAVIHLLIQPAFSERLLDTELKKTQFLSMRDSHTGGGANKQTVNSAGSMVLNPGRDPELASSGEGRFKLAWRC